ncbi:predicted protein [Nematostella vectensis]|uniref:3-hydroxyanthranilate 3,4-dioxygenase n=2 Tax=Nematostella vectensis TaxID=45351 RepID=3HAO_NEMVE|nr:RecName: Full=3-hydroxyanthranilate 3,4-dioxygenase; AltName: Full=3-hydroxyanthranilate oxygenase; Short=3-HAO; AltName: Full=3-hydroxyanthranilic acid dioxygenase; Short=HAD [Nematostella vectensis]EDO48567.1 predicted protein [Nematostella vectensis]|eukprot:XP_001640630.1 predicted protein [Nematostella vectensis]
MMEWIDENSSLFVPPVCNKLMYGEGQLKIMFVGGPNTRKDYHLEEGEELFFQVKGDMCLKVLEKGKPKDIIIKEGEMFLLPSRFNHSPQRFENTVGLVIERERLPEEIDGLRYFCEDGVTVLWEKFFHCTDLTQIAPVIKEFFESEEHKTGKPSKESSCSINVDTETELMEPFPLKQWLKDNKDSYRSGSMAIFEKGEFKVHAHGSGEQEGHSQGEMWFWQLEGKATVNVDEITRELNKNDVLMITAGSDFRVKREEGSVGLSITVDSLANK